MTQRNALTLLQLSRKEMISNTFINSSAMSNAAATLSTAFSSAAAAAGGSTANSSQASYLVSSSGGALELSSSQTSSSLKRQASVRKMLTLSKRKSFIINFKLQIDSVFDSIRKTRPNFVFCLLPEKHMNTKEFMEEINVPFLRSQLKAYQLLAACRIYRQGYPDFLNFEEFQRRFAMFLPAESHALNTLNTSDLMKQTCIQLIKSFDLDSSYYKIGTTQVGKFFVFFLLICAGSLAS